MGKITIMVNQGKLLIIASKDTSDIKTHARDLGRVWVLISERKKGEFKIGMG